MFYCDDGDDEAPELRRWRPRDNLSPAPPRGWLIATHFSGPTNPIDIGAWLYILATAQQSSKERGSRLYAMARDDHDRRVLVVDPAIGPDVTEAVETVYGAIQGCNCGGECIEPDLQQAASRVIARRRWKALHPADRVEFLLCAETEADIGLAFSDMDEIMAMGHADVEVELAYHG